jgi:hypothetical protein
MAIPANANNKYAIQKSNNVHCTSLGNTIIPIQGMRSNYSAIVRTFIIFMIVKIRRSSVNM